MNSLGIYSECEFCRDAAELTQGLCAVCTEQYQPKTLFLAKPRKPHRQLAKIYQFNPRTTVPRDYVMLKMVKLVGWVDFDQIHEKVKDKIPAKEQLDMLLRGLKRAAYLDFKRVNGHKLWRIAR